MNSSSVLILVIGILIAILLVIAGFVIPIFLTGGAGSGRPRSRPRTRVFADSPAGHLIVGFSYLYPRIDFAPWPWQRPEANAACHPARGCCGPLCPVHAE